MKNSEWTSDKYDYLNKKPYDYFNTQTCKPYIDIDSDFYIDDFEDDNDFKNNDNDDLEELDDLDWDILDFDDLEDCYRNTTTLHMSIQKATDHIRGIKKKRDYTCGYLSDYNFLSPDIDIVNKCGEAPWKYFIKNGEVFILTPIATWRIYRSIGRPFIVLDHKYINGKWHNQGMYTQFPLNGGFQMAISYIIEHDWEYKSADYSSVLIFSPKDLPYKSEKPYYIYLLRADREYYVGRKYSTIWYGYHFDNALAYDSSLENIINNLEQILEDMSEAKDRNNQFKFDKFKFEELKIYCWNCNKNKSFMSFVFEEVEDIDLIDILINDYPDLYKRLQSKVKELK